MLGIDQYNPFVSDDILTPSPKETDDKQIQKVIQPRFQKVRNALSSCYNSLKAKVTPLNGRKLATLLAAYPIAKIAIALVKGATISAAIALPPVALNLLITATSLFALSMLASLFIYHHRSTAKFIVIETIKFTAAPITSVYIVGKELKERIQHAVEASCKTPAATYTSLE